MEDSSNKDFSEKEYIGMNEYRCSTPHTPHTLHSKEEKRHPINIRLRRSIHSAVMTYCGNEVTAGQFYEEAAILFMDLNPKQEAFVVIERPHKNGVSLKDRMLDMICVGELSEIIPRLKFAKEKGYNIHKNVLESMRKIFDKCYRVSEPSVELSRLIEEALSYIE